MSETSGRAVFSLDIPKAEQKWSSAEGKNCHKVSKKTVQFHKVLRKRKHGLPVSAARDIVCKDFSDTSQIPEVWMHRSVGFPKGEQSSQRIWYVPGPKAKKGRERIPEV